MKAGVRSGLTLTGLCLLLIVATAWGWASLTKPLPKDDPVPVCEDTSVSAGTEVRRDQIVVSIFNGSQRSGLAGATRAQLTERGFVAGDVGDAAKTARTEIWADDKKNPAVQLVRRQFRKAKVVEGDNLGIGVVVVVGEEFKTLRRKQVESVIAKTDATYCKATGSE